MATRIAKKFPGNPMTSSAFAALARSCAPIPFFLGYRRRVLLDPILSLPGTNDHPGDYRGSGCTACHGIYANDRDGAHSGAYASFGHSGLSASSDPTIPKNEAGHPIKHAFTRSIPSKIPFASNCRKMRNRRFISSMGFSTSPIRRRSNHHWQPGFEIEEPRSRNIARQQSRKQFPQARARV